MPIRYTIQQMLQIAREYGGKCLSKEYFNDETSLKWMCSKGHTWDASYTIIRQGGWCVQCVKKESNDDKLKELQRIAAKKGGKCLSRNYTNNHTKLKWKCKENHEWEATSRSVNSWCPYCSGYAPRTIKDMQSKAQERGGKCLSTNYTNSQTKLWWQCAQKHKWQAKPSTIYRGTWCKACSLIEQSKRQRNDIGIYQRHAKTKKGILLSTHYLSSATPMQWMCAKKHVWSARGAQILNGSWCPVCAGKKKLTIEEMHQFAKLKGGKCLSKTYINNTTKLIWQCTEKHRWEAIPSNVINNNTWCPVCARKIIRLNLPQYRLIKKG